jgi:hypothetical protein
VPAPVSEIAARPDVAIRASRPNLPEWLVRKLHPIHARERFIARGGFHRPAGTERWSLHALPLGRHVYRVQDEQDGLWHLVIDDQQRPERLQARLRRDGRPVEVTMTFFDDEVLVWRRGAEPSSEAIALPPGHRLLWPPLAGRLRCLGFPPGSETPDPEQPAAIMTSLVRLASPARGLLTVRPVKFTLRTSATLRSTDGQETSQLRLITPGLPTLVATLDSEDDALSWHESSENAPDRHVMLGERSPDESATASMAGQG